MRLKGFIFISSAILALSSICIQASAESKEKTTAFPGAEGFGRYVTGGRGGTVYHVTSLADDGSIGTLRYAINQKGARTIIFDVSGTIHLTSALPIKQSDITIAGQTSPGDGICVADYPLSIAANNVIIRYMRFRLGNTYVTLDGADGWDGLGGMDQKDIIVDHCSISWSIDECCSIYGSTNTTVQWCLIAQSLRHAGHSKGNHGYGGNWGGSGASYHHNLLCHHESRTPRLGPRYTTQLDERMDMRNNVIYNWTGNGCYGGEAMNVNIVNNYYKPGPGTAAASTTKQERIAALGIRTTQYVTNTPSYKPTEHIWGKFFIDGNVNSKYPAVTNDNWTYGIYNQINAVDNDNLYDQNVKDSIRLASPIDFYAVTTHSAEDAYTKVLDYAGASLHRDSFDDIMISDTKNGTATYTGDYYTATGTTPVSGQKNAAGIINTPYDNKPEGAADDWSPWPTLNSTTAPADTDGDGMPNAYETANGLNPNDATDGAKVGNDGYTNLENYMNSIVSDITTNELAGGTIEGKTVTEDTPAAATSYELSTTTHSSDWLFSNGFSITTTKGYAAGDYNGIKYSRNVQFIINIPTGISIAKAEFTGYANQTDVDAYLSELNGKTFTTTDYVFPKIDASAAKTVKDYTIDLDSPVTTKLTFTPKGAQVVWKIILYTASTTKIAEISAGTSLMNEVYAADGKLIKRNATQKEINALPAGIYIVNHKAISVK